MLLPLIDPTTFKVEASVLAPDINIEFVVIDELTTSLGVNRLPIIFKFELSVALPVTNDVLAVTFEPTNVPMEDIKAVADSVENIVDDIITCSKS